MHAIAKGSSAEVQFVVSEEMQARFGGRTIHQVLSTWALIHHMEWAARELLEPALEETEEGVGAGVDMHHLSPALVGDAVRVRATAQSSARGKLVCAVEAFVGSRLIAKGTVYQAIWARAELALALSGAGTVRPMRTPRGRASGSRRR